MYSADLPTCCGIRFFRDFGNTNTAFNSQAYTPEEVDTYLKQQESQRQGNMAVLNTEQIKVLGSTFKANGWKCIRKFYYCGHGNNLHVMMKLHPINNKPRKL